MGFLSVAHSDVGIRKKTNQDSVLIKEASTDYGRILLAVICDGMGGLAKGEVASATLVRAFSRWFEEQLPHLLYDDQVKGDAFQDKLNREWGELIDYVNQAIANYSAGFHAACGTTVTAMLFAQGHYYIINVGDSRAYSLTPQIQCLTRDQTYVQREVDEGRMTEEEARNHQQKNVLLQCVGASSVVIPDFYDGTYQDKDTFFLCSDGFRHLITEEEFSKIMNPDILKTEKEMTDAAVYCTELNKQRKENDNISVIIIKID